MFARAAVTVFLTCALAGCSAGAGTVPRNSSGFSGQSQLPEVVQKGKDAQWVLFAPHTLGALYSPIVLGPDDNLWFIDETGAGLVRMAENGSIKEFALSGILTGSAVSMAVGADKNFYILDESTNVVRVTPKGKAQLFAIPSGDGTAIDGLALGPDGNVWFAEFNHIGKITPAGKITEFAYPTGFSTNQYGGVSAGSDGNVWFAESSGNAIGRIVPKSGKITMFPIAVGCTPASLVPAKDKNLWFACLANAPQLGSITPSGKIATYPVGGAFSSNETEQFCSEGPDGEPWCASGNDGNVFRVNTKAHTVTTFTPPLAPGVRPDALAGGGDGNIWVDTVGGEIAVLVASPMMVTPKKLAFSAPGQTKTVTVKENGTSSWSAKSSNPAVATVVQGSTKSLFKVNSVAKGRCKVIISDGTGNSIEVKVTVD